MLWYVLVLKNLYAVIYTGFEEFKCFGMCRFWRIYRLVYMQWNVVMLKNIYDLMNGGLHNVYVLVSGDIEEYVCFTNIQICCRNNL